MSGIICQGILPFPNNNVLLFYLQFYFSLFILLFLFFQMSVFILEEIQNGIFPHLAILTNKDVMDLLTCCRQAGRKLQTCVEWLKGKFKGKGKGLIKNEFIYLFIYYQHSTCPGHFPKELLRSPKVTRRSEVQKESDVTVEMKNSLVKFDITSRNNGASASPCCCILSNLNSTS